MKMVLLTVGATDIKAIVPLIEQYAGRIGRYVPFELAVIPDPRNRGSLPEKEQKEWEGKEILARLTPNDCAILLDEKGTEFTSRELSVFLNKQMVAGYKRIVWIVGGPYGFAPAVYSAVSRRWSLSRLTFPHSLVRLFAVEQLYRAFTILNNEPYHHD
jgi:23S rRNA (pseudouridine1915-N3)-methyltransferase